MVITRRARLLMLCAMLSLPLLHNATAAEPAIKPPISGLVSTGSSDNNLTPLTQKPAIFGGFVVQATWSQLQPNKPTAEKPVDTETIEQALARVRAYNRDNANRPLAVRLRVFSGCRAPEWAKSLEVEGKLVGPFDVNASCPGGFGPFWSHPYRQAWTSLVQQLAAKYDNHPLIQEVSVTSCTTYTAEPFIFPVGSFDEAVKSALRAAGYTDTKYRQCLEQAVADYAPWKTTRLTFPFNPFQGLTQRGDIAFAEQIMRGCRQVAGRRCVLDNHGLDSDPASLTGESHILPIYALIRRMGPEIAFQTLKVAPSDFEGTIRKGISLGAGSIEVWQERNGFEHVLPTTLQQWAAMFQPQ